MRPIEILVKLNDRLRHVLALTVLLAISPVTVPDARGAVSLSPLAQRLADDPTAVSRNERGEPIAAFGVPSAEARIVFLPVGKDRALPAGYSPSDLDGRIGRPVRALILDDLRAMISDAARDGVELAVVSGYRSPEQQAAAFEASVGRQLARATGPMDRSEAEARASRFVAPPGHSQHQLGTAIDLSTWELSYTVQPRFAETRAGDWVARNAWAYGFVLPYTRQGEARTGYAFEPWHVRWIGRPLASFLHADGYLDHPVLVADDYLRAVEEILDTHGL